MHPPLSPARSFLAAHFLSETSSPGRVEIHQALKTANTILVAEQSGEWDTIHVYELFPPGAFFSPGAIEAELRRFGWNCLTEHHIKKHIQDILQEIDREIQSNMGLSKAAESLTGTTIARRDDLSADAEAQIEVALKELGLCEIMGGDKAALVKKLSGTIITCLENRLEKISYCRRRAPEIDAGFFEQVCNGFSYEAYRINRAAPEEIGSETLRNLIWALEGTHDAEPIINSIRRVNGWITSPEDCSARIGSRAGAVVLGKTEGEEANSVVDSWIKLLLLAWSMMEIREILSRLDLAALRNQMKRLSEAVGKIVVEQFEDADQRLAYGRLGSEIDAVLSWADGNRRLSNLISPAFNQADKRKDSFQNALSLRLFEFCRCVEELRDNLESFDWLGGSLIASTLLDSLTKDLNRARSNIKPFSQNLRKMGEQAGTQLLEGIMTPRELPKEIDANRLFKFASDHRIGSVGKVPLERLRSTIPQHGK